MSKNPEFVKFDKVDKSYDGKVLVVKDLQLDIAEGEFITMLGPSGSGKTTCLMMLAGFETPTNGEIYLDSNPISNIPPHNLGEIVDCLIALVKNKDISIKKLSNIIKGPDFPTGGELIYSHAIEELYLTGKGSITIRGVVDTEEVNLGKGKHKKNAIIITELPYQINKAGWIEKLAELVNSGKIIGISDIRDESDRDGMRIVIEL